MSDLPPSQPLDYRDPRDDRTKSKGLTIFGGVAAGFVLLFLLQGVVLFAGSMSLALGWLMLGVAAIVVIGAVVAHARATRARRESLLFLKSFGIGALLWLLTNGACFIALSRARF